MIPTLLTLLSLINFQTPDNGGISFFKVDGRYELIAAPHDQTGSKGAKWGPKGIVNANSPSDGRKNTEAILAQKKPEKYSAAYMCDTLTLNGYDDWYLPAINELINLHEAQDIVGGFKMEDYASSTEERSGDNWSAHFKPHRKVGFWYNKSERYQVRCIRRVEY